MARKKREERAKVSEYVQPPAGHRRSPLSGLKHLSILRPLL